MQQLLLLCQHQFLHQSKCRQLHCQHLSQNQQRFLPLHPLLHLNLSQHLRHPLLQHPLNPSQRQLLHKQRLNLTCSQEKQMHWLILLSW
jgi:hypothetical protein